MTENTTLTPSVKTDIRSSDQQMIESFQEFQIRNDKEPRSNFSTINQSLARPLNFFESFILDTNGKYYPELLSLSPTTNAPLFLYSPSSINSLEELAIDKLYRATIFFRGITSFFVTSGSVPLGSNFSFNHYLYVGKIGYDITLPYTQLVTPILLENIGRLDYNTTTNSFTPNNFAINKQIDMIVNTELLDIVTNGGSQLFYLIGYKKSELTSTQENFLLSKCSINVNLTANIIQIGSIRVFND